MNNIRLKVNEPENRKSIINALIDNGYKVWSEVEKDLWTEVYNLGGNCSAGTALKEKYPEVFKAQKKQKEIAASINLFVSSQLGLNYRAVKLSDIFKISESMIEYYQPYNRVLRFIGNIFNKISDLLFKEEEE